MKPQFTENIHYSIELERAVLGSVMLEKFALSRIINIIDNPNIFYYDENKIIYSCFLEMYKQSVPIDTLTVIDYIINKKGLIGEFLDGVPYTVTKCTSNVVATNNLEYHSHVLKEMFARRRVFEIKYSPMEDSGLDPMQNIKIINEELNKLTVYKSKKEWSDMSELIIELYQHQEEMKATGGIGILSGFKQIDDANGGFFNGNMIFIGARPSVGKSALANTMAVTMALNNTKVGIVSLEMSNVEIAARVSAIDTDIDYSKIYRGLLYDEREKQMMYERITNSTVNLPIYVSDNTDVDMYQIRAKAERLKNKHGLDCLIIDYLQLIGEDEAKNSNRENQISRISRGCKILAKDLSIPVIVLGQLNREVTKRKGEERYPVLSDIRESGAIEQDSDIVMFLHSDFMSGRTEDENSNSTEGQADLVIRKWRNGKNNFIVPLDFIGSKMKFIERENGSSYTKEVWKPVESFGDVGF